MEHTINLLNTLMVLGLSAVALICTWGVFSRHYDDSLMQRIGMSGLAIGCIMRVSERMSNSESIETSIVALASVLFLALFAVGSAMKFVRSSRLHRPDRRVSSVHRPHVQKNRRRTMAGSPHTH